MTLTGEQGLWAGSVATPRLDFLISEMGRRKSCLSSWRFLWGGELSGPHAGRGGGAGGPCAWSGAGSACWAPGGIPDCRPGQRRRGGPLHSHPPCLPHSPADRQLGHPPLHPRARESQPPSPRCRPCSGGPCGPATRGGSGSVTLGLDTLGFRRGRADFLIRALLEGKVTLGWWPLQWEKGRFLRVGVGGASAPPSPGLGAAQPLPGVLSPTSLPAQQPCG